jgi:hypothetical protein
MSGSAGAATPARKTKSRRLEIPNGRAAELQIKDQTVKLTNLEKIFWPEGPITKRDLLQYYADAHHQRRAAAFSTEAVKNGRFFQISCLMPGA